MIPVPQYDNLLMSSVLLWADHNLLTKSRAFTNTNSPFLNVTGPFGNNVKTFASPFSQFIADSSISGANIPSGVYIDGNYAPVGQNGLFNIDYQNGRAYCTGVATTSIITGLFAVKYFNVKLTDESDEQILTKTSYNLRPKTYTDIKGLEINQTNYPLIMLRNNGSFNEPVTFGGLEKTTTNVRAIVLTDTEYSLSAANSIFRDLSKTIVPVFTAESMPYNAYGGLKSGSFNYNQVGNDLINSKNYAFVNEVYITKYSQNYVDIRALSQSVFWSIVDFEIESHRYPRQ